MGVGKPVVVRRPLVCIPARIHRRGAAIDVGGRIVTGIVGNVGSRRTAVAVTSTPMLKRGHVFASNDAAATVMTARSVADGGIDVDDPAAATRSDDAVSSMLEKGKGNKNGLEDIGIQA